MLSPIDFVSGHYDYLVFSDCARLRDDFVEDQQQAGGFWLPDRDGRKLYVVWMFKYVESAVTIVVDVSKECSPVVVERRPSSYHE